MKAWRIGILLFDGAEEMDFAGPWEVLSAAVDAASAGEVFTVAQRTDPVCCEKGMRIIPDRPYGDVPGLDVLVIPGGSGARREIGNPDTVAWLQAVAPDCAWITSVCTGAFLLSGAGLADGRRITTHHRFIEALREQHDGDVLDGVRMVRDGNIVTAAGVMSGIEMSLWLVSALFGEAVEAEARDYIAYDHPPRGAILGTE